MLKKDYNKWTIFRLSNSNQLSEHETKFIADLHAKYKNHSYYIPCTCSSSTWNRWIADINELYNNTSFESNKKNT